MDDRARYSLREIFILILISIKPDWHQGAPFH